MNTGTIQELGAQIDEAFLLIGAAVFLIELARALFKGSLKGRNIAEMFVSASTQIPFLAVEIFIMTGAYGIYYIISDTWVSWTMPLNGWTVALAILVADFFYYWEHRMAHMVRLFWTQHAVHHSSREFNVITSIRFGPLESAWSFFAFIPMVLLGFHPALVLFGLAAVLAYQTWIHTETIGKLGPIEWIFNTPSHHRVHHGADEKYLDKNYGGILIIWDRMFGSFQAEEEKPYYGLKRDFNSQNPLYVWFSELPQLWRDLQAAKSWREVFMRLFARPDWQPK